MANTNTGVQTSYAFDLAVAFAGQLADLNDFESKSGLLEGAANIPFGVGLKKGSADDGYVLPAAGGDLIDGIAIHTHAVDTIGLSGLSPSDAGLQPKQTFAVLRRGYIWVKVEEAVVRDDTAFCRYATGTGTQLGAWRKSADTSTAAIVKGARYMTSAAAGGYAILFFDAGIAGS